MRTKLYRIVFFTLTLFFMIGICTATAAPFDELVVFGDSLSDNGNYFISEKQAIPDPSEYYEGHFSNGDVWPEYLSDRDLMNISLCDKAFGGAESDGWAPLGLKQQVELYISAKIPPFTDGSLSNRILFAIWIGGNDCINGNITAEKSVDNIKDAMESLVEKKARHIMLLNLPDLGTVPRFAGNDRETEATQFSVKFNSTLAEMLDQFSIDYPEIGLYAVDIFSFFNEVRSNPSDYGFTNITDPSPNFDEPDEWDGAGHLFWDEIHPTTDTHAHIARRVYEELSEQVPESQYDEETDNSAADVSCFIDTLLRFDR